MCKFHFIVALYCLAVFGTPAHAQSTSDEQLSLAESTVARYCTAWGNVDPSVRESLLAEIWTEDGEYMDSQPVRIKGRLALSAEILRFQVEYPGATFRCTNVQTHHGFVGYTWVMVGPNGAEGFKGMDFGELDAAGRLVRIVSFFGAPSPAK